MSSLRSKPLYKFVYLTANKQTFDTKYGDDTT